MWVHTQVWEGCQKLGYVQTLAGRRRYYPGIATMSPKVSSTSLYACSAVLALCAFVHLDQIEVKSIDRQSEADQAAASTASHAAVRFRNIAYKHCGTLADRALVMFAESCWHVDARNELRTYVL